MEVGIKFIEILRVEFEPASDIQGYHLGGCFVSMPGLFSNNICAVLTFI